MDNGWNVVTLERYLSQKIKALSDYTAAEHRASERAVAAALLAAEKIESNMDAKIDLLQSRLDIIEGKSKGIGEGWGIIVAAGGLATGILIAIASYIR